MYKRDNLFSNKINKIKNWSFNKKVTKVFSDMVVRSIPGYYEIIYIINLIAKNFIKPYSNIYDLGCSTGNVCFSISRNIKIKNFQIIAVDKSKHMISFCRRKINIFNKKKIKLITENILKISIKNASMVILNFTMQFISLNHRLFLINKIYNGINPGGVLVISEKFKFSDKTINNLICNMYQKFKIDNEYSKLEIFQKKIMLKNVMFTEDFKTHKKRLKKVGFNHVELCLKYLNFGLIIAIKKG